MYQKVTKQLLRITGPFHYCLSFQKILNKLYIKDYYHLTWNNTLVKEQSGFRCNNSTETAKYTLIKNIFSIKDKILVGGLFWN